jgi:CheY-like chemotaxis protein
MNPETLKKIVVVDDTYLFAFMVKDFLNAQGYTNVTAYDDPKKAFDEIRNGDEPAVVITDYNMPGMNGVELLNELDTVERADLKGIIMTSDPLAVRDNHKKYHVIEKRYRFLQKIIDALRNSQCS